MPLPLATLLDPEAFEHAHHLAEAAEEVVHFTESHETLNFWEALALGGYLALVLGPLLWLGVRFLRGCATARLRVRGTWQACVLCLIQVDTSTVDGTIELKEQDDRR